MTLLRFAGGAVGSLEATRNAYGRNNFLTFEIHGETGSIVFNYERRDELQVFFAEDAADRRGFRTIYTGPAHPYGDGLWPIPGLGIGFGETKIVECLDLMRAIVDGTPVSPNFGDGYQIAKIAAAIAESAAQRTLGRHRAPGGVGDRPRRQHARHLQVVQRRPRARHGGLRAGEG